MSHTFYCGSCSNRQQRKKKWWVVSTCGKWKLGSKRSTFYVELFFFAELAALLRAIDEVTNFPRELSEEKKTWVCVIHPRTKTQAAL